MREWAYSIIVAAATIIAAACAADPPPHEDAVTEAKRTCEAFDLGHDSNCLLSIYRTARPRDASEILMDKPIR